MQDEDIRLAKAKELKDIGDANAERAENEYFDEAGKEWTSRTPGQLKGKTETEIEERVKELQKTKEEIKAEEDSYEAALAAKQATEKKQELWLELIILTL